ncbi:MAG: hypothetical protein R3D86_03060 [Emcibacteraceae bacterium]
MRKKIKLMSVLLSLAILLIFFPDNFSYSQNFRNDKNDIHLMKMTELQQKIKELEELGFFYVDYENYIDANPKNDLSDEKIEIANANIEFIEKNFPGLSFEISNASQNQLNILSKLTSLMDLAIWNSDVNNLKALSNNPYLEYLHLYKLKNINLEDLSIIKSLKNLNIDKSNIINLSSLNQMTSIESLSFVDTVPININLLLDLPNLNSLRVQNTKIENQSSLKKLKNLKSLILESTNYSNFNDLKNLKKLERLYISKSDISDLTPISELTELQDLALTYTKVDDLSPLSNLNKLRYISLYRSWVEDISPLSKLKNLHSPDIRDTRVKDVSSLENHQSTIFEKRRIDIRAVRQNVTSKIEKIKKTYPVPFYPERPIGLILSSDNDGLLILKPENTLFNDHDLKSNMSEINKQLMNHPDLLLDLSETFVSDLSPLSSLHNLKKLNVARTPINDLSPLSALINLIELDVSGRLSLDVYKNPDGTNPGTIVIQADMDSDEFTSILKDKNVKLI